MPLSRTQTYTGPGTTASWNLDPSIAPFDVSISCAVLGGATASYKLQYSYDTLDNPTLGDSSATWFDSTDIPAATATSKSSALVSPVARIRLVIATLTGGTLQMTTLQGMSIN